MKRILLIGNSPLPNENTKIRPAAGLRTWQFLKALEKRCVLRLVTIAMPECYGEGSSHKQQSVTHARGGQGGDNLTMVGVANVASATTTAISKNDPDLQKKLQTLHDEFQPEAIISVNTYPSCIACGLKSHAPLWCDLNGWIMAEAQAQAYKMDSNDYLSHYFGMESAVLRRADKFSAVSRAQSFALLGELASFGRLNKESFGYKFVEHVPNGIEWFEGEEESVPGQRNGNEMTRGNSVPGNGISSHKQQSVTGDNFDWINDAGNHIPKDSFVLLWIGGYNTWVDEITLFKAVNDAMAKCEKLYFVSTGGEIAGLDNKTFAKFKKMIEESPHKNRFIFLGWVDTAQIPSLYKRAQAGINVDRRCVETLTGARNRINEMMKFGLPVVTTLGSEIAGEVEKVGAGLATKSGDHLALTQAIIEFHEEWRGGGGRETMGFKQYGKNGQEYIRTFCNYETTVKPLLEWLENPRPAPDRNVKVKLGGAGGLLGGLPSLKTMWTYLKQNGFKKSFEKFLQKVRG